MARTLKSDRFLFLAALLLVATSLVMVYSASAAPALEHFQQPSLFLMKQALWTALGLVALSIAMRVDYRRYRHETVVWSAFGLVLLLLVAVLFRGSVNGARRWFGVGGLGVQPSEPAKLVCVLVTALVLDRRMHRIDEAAYAVLPIAIMVGMLAGLVLLQPDFGTAMSLLLIAGVMIFAAGVNYRHIAGAVLVAIPTLSVLVLGSPYRRQRVRIFFDPWCDPFGAGYHIIQALIAVGSGGVWGKGLMNGVQKLFYVPEPYTDFIFAVVAEELGLVGTTAIVLSFAVMAWRGLRIAMRAEDAFGSFVALGLTTMIAVQGLINMSVVLKLLPTTGIALPLVSYGGSSLLVNLYGVGVLLNISQHESAVKNSPA
jgi:cell division protein FtsW